MTKDEDLDHTPLGFGKHAGRTPEQVSAHSPGYIIWLYENCTPQVVSRALYADCRDEVAARDWEGDDRPF